MKLALLNTDVRGVFAVTGMLILTVFTGFVTLAIVPVHVTFVGVSERNDPEVAVAGGV